MEGALLNLRRGYWVTDNVSLYTVSKLASKLNNVWVT